jgi:hypothetical protein
MTGSGTPSVSSSVSVDAEDGQPSINGFGAFIFPERVTVSDIGAELGELKEADLDNRYRNQEPLYEKEFQDGSGISISTTEVSRTREVVIDHKLSNGEEVIVSDDGFIGVFMPKENAIPFLNTIFGTALTLGYRGELLLESDLCQFEWDRSSKQIRITSYDIMSERNRDALMRDDPRSNQHKAWSRPKRTQLRIDRCKEILDRAQDYMTNPELHNDLILSFEGFTLVLRGAFRAAFLYGWMIIETFLAKLWDDYVNSQKGKPGQSNTPLKNSSQLAINDIIINFSNTGKISGRVSNLLHKIRKKRNDIVHDRVTVDIDEAAGCLQVVNLIIRNRLQNPQFPFSDIENTKLVSRWNC